MRIMLGSTLLSNIEKPDNDDDGYNQKFGHVVVGRIRSSSMLFVCLRAENHGGDGPQLPRCAHVWQNIIIRTWEIWRDRHVVCSFVISRATAFS